VPNRQLSQYKLDSEKRKQFQKLNFKMNRIALSFSRFGRGNFSHFAHFICNFALPFYSLLKKNHLLELISKDHCLTVEIHDEKSLHIDPLLPLAREIFPGLNFEYVSRFSVDPMFCEQLRRWHNDPGDVEDFMGRLKSIVLLKPLSYGVVVVQRGTDREKYPGGCAFARSGADRRRIGAGFDELVDKIKEKRPDTVSVVLEQLTFAEQVSLFVNADTLIAQHGAAFVHAQWMLPQSHLIELQCRNGRRFQNFVRSIASIRNHRLSVVDYPCAKKKQCVIMNVSNPNEVVQLIGPRK
jgi:Glycosyltransferase 61